MKIFFHFENNIADFIEITKMGCFQKYFFILKMYYQNGRVLKKRFE